MYCISGVVGPVCASIVGGSPVPCSDDADCTYGVCGQLPYYGGQCGYPCVPRPTPLTISVSGTVRELVPGMGLRPDADEPPLAEVDVCSERDPSVCTSTDASGGYRLEGVPNQDDIWISYRKAGYAPARQYVGTNANGDQFPLIVRLMTEELVESLVVEAGGTYPAPDTGVIAFGVGMANSTASVSAQSFGLPLPGESDAGALQWVLVAGAQATATSGVGPVYADADGSYDATLDRTVSGSGAFVNVTPGDVTISVAPVVGSPCIPVVGTIPAGGDNRAAPFDTLGRVTVVAGFITTNVGFLCE